MSNAKVNIPDVGRTRILKLVTGQVTVYGRETLGLRGGNVYAGQNSGEGRQRAIPQEAATKREAKNTSNGIT